MVAAIGHSLLTRRDWRHYWHGTQPLITLLLQVGAQTETELKEKKLRVEDALNATKVRPRAIFQHRLVVLSVIAPLSAEPAEACHMPYLCALLASAMAATAPISCPVQTNTRCQGVLLGKYMRWSCSSCQVLCSAGGYGKASCKAHVTAVESILRMRLCPRRQQWRRAL